MTLSILTTARGFAFALIIALGNLLVMGPLATAEAGHRKQSVHAGKGRVTVARLFKVTKPQVAGFVFRAGRISYDYEATLRVPPRVDPAGPFDSGFFFDSNVTTWTSQAPYMN